jgi:predicted acyl esterase
VVSAAAVLLLGIPVLAPAKHAAPQAAAEEPGWETTETHIPNPDGTLLHAYIHRPAGLAADAKTPVSMIVSPYLNSGGGWFVMGGAPDPARPAPFQQPSFPYLVQHGFTEVQVEPRGYGGSTGCPDFGGPGEQSDVVAAVEWAASRRWSTGKVGIFGGSYEGGMAASAVRNNPKGLAAAFLSVPVTSYYRYAQTNGINNITGGEAIYNLPHGLMPPSANEDDAFLRAYAESAASDPRCQLEGTIATATQNRESDPYWTARDYKLGLPETTVPVFFNGALQDENVVPSYILPYVNQLTGPVRAWLGQWQHEAPPATQFGAELVAWFQHYVADKDVPVAEGFAIQSSDGTWRNDTAWPGPDLRPLTVPLLDGGYRELEYTLGDGHPTDFWPPMSAIPADSAAPAIHWAAVTQPLPYDVHLSGEAVFRGSGDIELPTANVVVTVLDIDPDPDGLAHYLTRGAYLAEGDGPLEFRIFPQDWKLPAGHRIGVIVSGSTSVHYNAANRWIGTSGQQVKVSGGSLTFPTLVHRRVPCTEFSQQMLSVDVIYHATQAQREGAAVTATLPGPFAGEQTCPGYGTTLTYTGETRVRGESVLVAARLVTDTGAPLRGQEVAFTVAGVTRTAVTDVAGVAATTVDIPDHGRSQTVDLRYAGSPDHSPSSTSTTLTWGQ